MWFNSVPFLVFFPIFAGFYAFTKGRTRLAVSLVASYIFYAWWDWRFLSLIMISTGVDYLVGLKLEQWKGRNGRRKFLFISLFVDLGILGFFKYFNFFQGSTVQLLAAAGFNVSRAQLAIALPVGISFYTFQTLSYTIDVYRGRISAEKSLLRFATFVAFFPQLVAGPIVRASHFIPQLHVDNAITWDNFVSGGVLVLWGYVKKVVIADGIAPIVDHVFAHAHVETPPMIAIGVLFYTFQIYCDFSGYSDIAIGLARILGFDFGINFDRPYFATSFREFWRRWHISLSTWLRDYLYIPLGGSRGGKVKTYRNIMITMLLGGLWHGASWTFVVWGGLHGTFLVFERAVGARLRWLSDFLRVPRVVRQLALGGLVFALTAFAWVFFRSQTFSQAMIVLGRLSSWDQWSLSGIHTKFVVVKGGAMIAMLFAVDALSFHRKTRDWFSNSNVVKAAAAALCLWMIAFWGTFNGHQFIYFQF